MQQNCQPKLPSPLVEPISFVKESRLYLLTNANSFLEKKKKDSVDREDVVYICTHTHTPTYTSLVVQMVKKSVCNAGGPGFDPWDWKTPWRREWLPTPVFLPGELHGRRNLVGYSLWGHKELDD